MQRAETFKSLLQQSVTHNGDKTSLVYSGVTKEPLGAEGVEVLKKMLRTMPKLTELRLPSCKIGPLGAAHMSVTIALDQTLTVLDLSKNGLKTEGALHVARAIRNCRIEKIFLVDNGIDHSCPELWPLLFSSGVRALALYGNRDIKSKGALDVAAVMESGESTVEKLDMGDCGIKQAAGETLLSAAAISSAMRAIRLEKNDFKLQINPDAIVSATGGGKKDRRKTTRLAKTAVSTSESALNLHSAASSTFINVLRCTTIVDIKVGLAGPQELQDAFSDALRMMCKQNTALAELQKNHAKDGLLSFKSRMLRSIPEAVLKPTWVTVLDLRKNFLPGLPYSIVKMSSLTALDISDNSIESDAVPVHLNQLKRLKVLRLDENPFLTWKPDPQSPSVSLTAMRNLGEERVACNFMKVVVIGQENVGKTTLVDTLYRSLNDEKVMKHKFAQWKKRLQERKEGRQWTDGIEICQTMMPSSDANGPPLALDIWDFAGQAVYYPTHQLFLSSGTAIFIVAFDLSSLPSMARVRYWLDAIVSQVRQPAIILVGTHKDKCNNWEEVCESVRQEHASRRDMDIRGVFAIRATQLSDMGPIRQCLQEAASSKKLKDWLGKKFPRNFTFLASMIREENALTRNPIISRSEFRKWAAVCGIVDSFDECLEWLAYTGSILRFPSMLSLREQIFLSPHWLVSVMSRLVTWRSDAVAAVVGTFFDDDIPVLWPAKYFPESLRGTIISLLTHFEILYPLTDTDSMAAYQFQQVFIVPCMLPEEEPPFSPPLLVGKTYQRRFKFAFAPFGMFPQLLIRMLALCRTHLELWKWGMVGIVRAAGSRHLVSVRGSFDASGSGTVDFSITTNDESGLVLHIIISPLEALLRSCYPNTMPTRFAIKPDSEGREELVEIDSFLSDGKGFVEDKHAVSSLVPDLTLSSALRIEPSELEMVREIGRGGFGAVHLARFKKRKVVVKQLLHANVEGSTKAVYAELLRECWMMSFLDHINVVALLGVSLSPLSIVMEHANEGDLRLFLDGKFGDLSLFVRLKLLIDVASGMNYAHSQTPPIVHMDLKSPNVLVSRGSDGVLTAKIADLGLATVFSSSMKHEVVGINPRWLAPEAIRGERISRKVDVYAFAIIMWEVMTGKFPFALEEPQYPFSFQFADAIAEGLRPSVETVTDIAEVPAAFPSLMTRCWSADAQARPAFLECLQLLYQMQEGLGKIPSAYESKGALVSQLGILTCPSLSLVKQVLVCGQEVAVLQADGTLSLYQTVDGQALWSLNVLEYSRQYSLASGEDPICHMCLVDGSELWVCDTLSSNINVVSLDGARDYKTSQLRMVHDMVAVGGHVALAGEISGGGLVHSVEVWALESGKKTVLREEMRGLFGGVAFTARSGATYAWFLQQEQGRTRSAHGVADSAVQVCLETGMAHVVAPPQSPAWIFLVPVEGSIWAFDSAGGVTVIDGETREMAPAFSVHQPLLMGVYVPSVRRVAAVSRNQSVCMIHPEFKTVATVTKTIPIAFSMASKALSVMPSNSGLGQLVVGGESVALFKIHKVKSGASSGLTVKKKAPKHLVKELQENSRVLDAMSQRSVSLTMSARASSYAAVTDEMDIFIQDLAASSRGMPSVGDQLQADEGAPKKRVPMLQRQESELIDDEGFESMIRDLSSPLMANRDLKPPATEQPPKAKGAPGSTNATPTSPRRNTSTNTRSNKGSAASSTTATPTSPRKKQSLEGGPAPPSRPLPPVKKSGSSTSLQASAVAARAAPSSGSKIRAAYGVREKVKVRTSPPGAALPFQTEVASGIIGYGKKEGGFFVFYDLTGIKVLLKLPLSEMESAKKPVSPPPHLQQQQQQQQRAAPAPQPVARPRPMAPPRSSTKPRQHLVNSKSIREVLFRWAHKVDFDRTLMQFRGWAHVLTQMADMSVRYELVCKLYFEYLNPVDATSALHLPSHVMDPLMATLMPLMEAEDMARVCALPSDFFKDAIASAESMIREKQFGPFLKDMGLRLRQLEHQTRKGGVEDVTRELSATKAAAKLSFEEFLAILSKYRPVTPPRPDKVVPSVPLGIASRPPAPSMSPPRSQSPRSRPTTMALPKSRTSSSGHISPRSSQNRTSRSASSSSAPSSPGTSPRGHPPPRPPERHNSFGSEHEAQKSSSLGDIMNRSSRSSSRGLASRTLIPRTGERSSSFGSSADSRVLGGDEVRQSERDEYVIPAAPPRSRAVKPPPSKPPTPYVPSELPPRLSSRGRYEDQ